MPARLRRTRQRLTGTLRLLFALLAGPALVVTSGAAVAAAAEIRVVATLPPIHSLVAAVMAGAGQPALLLARGASPHQASLAPSRIRLLRKADVVFRISGRFQTYLNRPLAASGIGARIVALADTPGLTLLPRIAGGSVAEHGIDPHIWLDPGNAEIMTAAAARALAGADPANAALYRANAARTRERIRALHHRLGVRLAPLRTKPYVVFHDAYRYFERRFGLGPVVAVTADAERRPGARHLIRVRRWIAARKVQCVFTEPQFAPPLAAALIRGTGARIGVLDPLGAALEPDQELYFTLMRGLAAGLGACLN